VPVCLLAAGKLQAGRRENLFFEVFLQTPEARRKEKRRETKI
jgi:hypothetical protein